MAGVAQNSDFKTDPWGRLVRTATYVATTVYGTTGQAEAAGRRLSALHARMRARDPVTGQQFRIDEPDLLRWVHVAEVESFVSTARRAGSALTREEIDAYYTEQRRSAALVGLDPAAVPGTMAEVEGYYREIRADLRMTREAAETAFFLTAPPVPWKLSLPLRLSLGPARLAYLGLAGTAFGLLPAWARRMYGMLGLPTAELSAELSVRALRLALGAIPRRYIEGPIYRAAMTRAARLAPASPPDPAAGSSPVAISSAAAVNSAPATGTSRRRSRQPAST
jgi:uncharacterized protein (DUF2236 family)